MVLIPILALLSALGLALTLWQWTAGRRFPLHDRGAIPNSQPPVSILKPLKGADPETAACLETWLTQDYPGPVQILFGVATEQDPAAAVVRDLLQRHPATDAELVHCPERLGANAKVSSLVQLARQARHELVLISDGDVAAPPDLLRHLLAPMADPGVGLAHCFYRMIVPGAGQRPAVNTPTHWEAVGVNIDFWSQVLQSKSLWPLDFALGAAMATSRRWLAQMGGHEALADYLADDFQLGHRIAQAGGRVECCRVVVDCREAPKSWRAAWSHQLRWARTIRVCRPVPYFFSILGNATLWPALWVAAAGVASIFSTAPVAARAQSCLLAVGGLLVCLLVRIGTGLNLQHRLRVPPANAVPPWVIPVKDLLGAVVWGMALLGNTVEWRGHRYRVRRDGRLRAS